MLIRISSNSIKHRSWAFTTEYLSASIYTKLRSWKDPGPPGPRLDAFCGRRGEGPRSARAVIRGQSVRAHSDSEAESVVRPWLRKSLLPLCCLFWTTRQTAHCWVLPDLTEELSLSRKVWKTGVSPQLSHAVTRIAEQYRRAPQPAFSPALHDHPCVAPLNPLFAGAGCSPHGPRHRYASSSLPHGPRKTQRAQVLSQSASFSRRSISRRQVCGTDTERREGEAFRMLSNSNSSPPITFAFPSFTQWAPAKK